MRPTYNKVGYSRLCLIRTDRGSAKNSDKAENRIKPKFSQFPLYDTLNQDWPWYDKLTYVYIEIFELLQYFGGIDFISNFR